MQLILFFVFAQNFLLAVTGFEAIGLARLQGNEGTYSLTLWILHAAPLQKADLPTL